MTAERLANLVRLYERKDTIEAIVGDTTLVASAWLASAEQELSGVDSLIELGQWRLAYNASYDICRHAAEAVNTEGGYRVKPVAGAHEATFALADALVGESSGPFSAASASKARQMRHALEYIDTSRPHEVDEHDSRWVRELAREAVNVAKSFLEDRNSRGDRRSTGRSELDHGA